MTGDNYIFATGTSAENRLGLVDAVYGPTSRAMLQQVKLQPGWCVADIGCGAGHISRYMAREVGPLGKVVAVDISREQLAVAQSRSSTEGLDNIEFIEASAQSTGLPAGSVDLIYSRLLLSHLRNPQSALAEFWRLLKPEGALVCEDLVATRVYSEPETAIYAKLRDLAGRFSANQGVNYSIGEVLPHLIREQGFDVITVRRIQPAFFHGEEKRWWEYSVREAGPMLLQSGFLTELQLAEFLAALEAVSLDCSTLIGQPILTQVFASRR